MRKISEMTQEDQGSATRIEELERQHNMLRSAMAHMNGVHQGPKAEYEVVLMRIEEMNQHQHVRMTREYEKLTTELKEKARENLHLRASYSSAESTLSEVVNRLKLVKDEEHNAQSES